MAKSKNSNVHFIIDTEDKDQIEKVIQHDGFDNISTFYRFITKQYIRGNVRIDTKKDEYYWEVTPEHAKELRRIDQEETSKLKTYTNVDDLMNDLMSDYEDTKDKKVSKKLQKSRDDK